MKKDTSSLTVNPQITEHFFQGRLVRTAGDLEHPLFCVKDVCDILGLSHTHKAGQSLDPEDLTGIVFRSGGQKREMLFATEIGLYALIFQSRKPEAKAFKRWVFEVIRSIRKNGFYMQTGLTVEQIHLRAAQLEVQACEYELSAKRARLAKAAVLRNELPGAVPVGSMVHDLAPHYSQPKQASLCSYIIRTAELLQIPVGHTRVSHGKVRTMHPEDFKTALEELAQNRPALLRLIAEPA